MALSNFGANPPKSNYQRVFKSPIFRFSNASSIATSGRYLIDYYESNSSMQKYGSFNYIRVVNNSSEDILVYPNQDTSQGQLIPANQTTTFDETVIQATTSLLIENVGSGTISASQITVHIWKDRTDVESIASNLHAKFYSNEPNPFIPLGSVTTNQTFGGQVLGFLKKKSQW